MTPEKLARYFDHTILKPDATSQDVIKICEEAKKYDFFSVCVNPVHIQLVCQELKGSDVKKCAVVGFPLGANTSKIKALETKTAIEAGADEIDMVINIGALKDGNFQRVQNDIMSVVDAAKGRCVKVIIETCLLSTQEKIKACELSKAAGAHFVKTSTGFSTSGATKEDVALMRKTMGDALKVKASGGIKTLDDTLSMIMAGADRIGASAGADILASLK